MPKKLNLYEVHAKGVKEFMQHQLAAYIQLKAGVILELFSLFLSGLKSA